MIRLSGNFSAVGSPSIRREWIEMYILSRSPSCARSPSIRREWIEMRPLCPDRVVFSVSLHTEGVD